ncbi:MAG: methylenetetrahydrofolate reductase C-terminal domain-containing protein [Acutalibacteraceae bacterium]
MIVTRKKPVEQVLAMLHGVRRVALVGCASCAAACQTGGGKELEQMRQLPQEQGIETVGTVLPDECCHMLLVKRDLKPLRDSGAEAIVCLACGDGTQTVAANTAVPVFPANDTLFLGQIERAGVFREACRMCGDCMLGQTGGICPVTQCAKSLVHGPCGGQRNGRCEVNPENECAWLRIYRKLKELDRLDLLEADRADKDYRSTAYPQAHSLREIRKKGGTPMSELKRTVLYQAHLDAGATMVDFGGWDMPIQYPDGIVAEHLYCRSRCAIFDVSHMGRIDVEGPDMVRFLQHVLSSNVQALDINQAQYCIIPDQNGCAIDDAYLYRFEAEKYFLVINAGNIDKDLAHLTREAERYNVTLTNVSDRYAAIAVQGPEAKSCS